MDNLKFRKASRSDVDRIVEIMIGDPEQVTTQVGMKLFGVASVDQLGSIAHAMATANKSWEFTTVAELANQASGILQTSEPSLQMSPRLIVMAVRTYGPFFMRKLIPRIQLLNKVQTIAPPNAFKISEMHVAPKHRGRGIGLAILKFAEAEARAAGHSMMSLQTWTTNPASRLYERFGFKVAATRTNDEFERLTGVAGNNLMVKELIEDTTAVG